MATSTQNNFDFSTYNGLMKTAKTGLKLFLAMRLLQDCESTHRRFSSPFAREFVDLNDELKDLRERIKAYTAKLENAGGSAEIDNQDELKKPSTSADAGKVAA